MRVTPTQVILGILIAAVAILIVMMIVFLLRWKNGSAPLFGASFDSYTPEDTDPEAMLADQQMIELENSENAESIPTDEVPHQEPDLTTTPPVIEHTPRPTPDKLLPSDNIASFGGDILIGSELNNA